MEAAAPNMADKECHQNMSTRHSSSSSIHFSHQDQSNNAGKTGEVFETPSLSPRLLCLKRKYAFKKTYQYCATDKRRRTSAQLYTASNSKLAKVVNHQASTKLSDRETR